jgi:hypothetical protein
MATRSISIATASPTAGSTSSQWARKCASSRSIPRAPKVCRRARWSRSASITSCQPNRTARNPRRPRRGSSSSCISASRSPRVLQHRRETLASPMCSPGPKMAPGHRLSFPPVGTGRSMWVASRIGTLGAVRRSSKARWIGTDFGLLIGGRPAAVRRSYDSATVLAPPAVISSRA